METNGLSVSVYRWTLGDCTAGGISSKYDSLILEGVPRCPFKGTEENTVRLVKRNLFGGEYIHAEPIKQPEGMAGPMFGGNFIYTSDSRFPSKYPIPVHDRFETWEAYEHLSR